MERRSIDNILSIQNLSSVNHINQPQPPVNPFSPQRQMSAAEIFQHMQLLHVQHLSQQQQQQQQQQQHQQQQQQQLPHQRKQQQQRQQQLQRNNNNNNNNHLPIPNNHIAQQQQASHQFLQQRPSQQLVNQQQNEPLTTVQFNNHHEQEKELIDLITCKLCQGYLIDAYTIDKCMHSFCKACAFKYIRDNPSCPECHTAIPDKRTLNRLKPDITIQNIVYKLVPGLYEKEMARRRKYYAARPSPTPRYRSEMFGDIPPSKVIRPDEMLNVSIAWNRDCPDELIKTFLHCRADTTMLVLKKLIVGKFGLDRPIRIYYENSEIFFDITTLMDVAATFNWAPENKILNLNFKEAEDEVMEEVAEKVDEKGVEINSLSLMNSVLDP